MRQSASIIGQLFREIGEVPQPPMLSDLAEEMGEVSFTAKVYCFSSAKSPLLMYRVRYPCTLDIHNLQHHQ